MRLVSIFPEVLSLFLLFLETTMIRFRAITLIDFFVLGVGFVTVIYLAIFEITGLAVYFALFLLILLLRPFAII